MTRIKKMILPILCVIILLFAFIGFTTTKAAYAETCDLLEADYTSDDRLLKSDGSYSSKTITKFAEEVRAASINKKFPELSEVIPKQYLETEQNNAIFKYFGKEYGFYVEKTGPQFSVLLIDFTYEFDDEEHTAKEYKIRVEPILQQSFLRLSTDSGYTYSTMIGGYVYYMANPRFLTVLQNENALNYGDIGYSKLEDNGLIISQSRVNYGHVSLASKSDLFGDVNEFAGEKVLDYAIELIDNSGFVGLVKDVIELGFDIANDGKEVTVLADNESNIFTQQSKDEQRSNSDLDGYSRVAAFMPSTEIVLSDSTDSYAEFITVLNDTNHRSRLIQVCDFDIYRKESGLFNPLEYVTGADQDNSYSISKQRLLFDDKNITDLSNTSISQQKLAYFLPEGNQKFSYSSPDNAYYQIKADEKLADLKIYEGDKEVDFQKLNDNCVEFYLEKDKKYIFELSQSQKGYYNLNFTKKTEAVTTLGEKPQDLLSGESKYYEYTGYLKKYIAVNFDPNKYIIDIYVGPNGETVNCNSLINMREFFAEAGKTYYISCSNVTSSDITNGNIKVDDVEKISVNEPSSFAVNDERHLLLETQVSGKYEFIWIENGISATLDAQYDGNSYFLKENTSYYVTLKGNSAQAKCCIQFVSQDISVNGEESKTIHGDTQSVFLKFIPKETLNYSIKVSVDANVQLLTVYGEIINFTDTDKIPLNKGTTYYFRVETISGNLPSNFKVILVPNYISNVLEVNQTENSGAITYVSSGTDIIKLIINEYNLYDFSESNIVLYDSQINRIEVDSPLLSGVYFLKVTSAANIRVQLTVRVSGDKLNVNDVIAVTKSEIFKYQLTKGVEYEIRVGGSDDKNYSYEIKIYDSKWQYCPIASPGQVYSFIATDNVIYVELTMRNMNGQAAIFTLKNKNLSSGNVCQNINVETIYPLEITNDGKLIKIQAGNYNLFIKKNIGETLRLYELDGNSTINCNYELVDGETLQQSTALKYSISLSADTVFVIVSDNEEVDCMLSYSNANYLIEVKNNIGLKDLSIGNGYEFALYREMNGANALINTMDITDFRVFQGDGNGEQVENVNGKFEIIKDGQVNIYINFWGIEAHRNYVVNVPSINAGYSVDYRGLNFNVTEMEYNSNIGYNFSRMYLKLYANNTCIYSTDTAFKTCSLDISSYISYRNLKMNVNYEFKKGEQSFSLNKDFSYSVPYYLINASFGLGQNNIAIIDASKVSNITLNKTISIPSNIAVLYLKGSSNSIVKQLDISIESRSSTLTVFMDNFSYQFKKEGLNMPLYGTLNLHIIGECSIAPRDLNTEGRYGLYANKLNILGSGKLSVTSGKHETSMFYEDTTGYPGIYASWLTISVRELYVKGGTGGDSPNATGPSYYGLLDGAHANPGGHGGYAIFVVTEFNVSSSCRTLTMAGGNGGNGGNGADGLNGTGSGVAGGKGGNGGDGGSYGETYIVRSANYNGISSSTTLIRKDGDYGNGGNGGRGGDGGAGGRGGDGGKGGYGYIGGRGGNGGNGGDGEKGRDAVFITGQSGSNGGNGGDGGNGGAGGDSKNKAGTPGFGGTGGLGGKGGEKGKGIFKKYQDGQSGNDGVKGDDGEYW